MRVKKTIKGDVYNFYVQFVPNSMTASIRYFQSDEWIICQISKDFKHILIPENTVGVIQRLEIKSLTLNKYQQLDAKMYNGVDEKFYKNIL